MHGLLVTIALNEHGALTDGQVVTILVGLGMVLLELHRRGEAFGPIHPAHVAVAEDGRPFLRPVTTPIGWTAHDDWVGLLRFGRLLGSGPGAFELDWQVAGRREGVDLLRWLMRWARPAPLPILLD